MKNTSNYNLKKPEGNDKIDIDDLNYNTSIIDSELKKLNDKNISLDADIKASNYGQITDSQDSIISLTGGYNGIANLDIKGNTLVNLCGWSKLKNLGKGKSSTNIIIDDQNKKFTASFTELDTLRIVNAINKNGSYTVIFTAYSNTSSTFTVDICDTLLTTYQLTTTPQTFVYYANINNYSNEIYNFIDFSNITPNCTIALSNIIILEGDYTKNPPQEYFEGMKSVDKMEVISRTNNLIKNGNCENGLNYWNSEPLSLITIENNKFKITSTGGNTGTNGIFQLIKVKSNTNYHLKWNSTMGTTESRGAISLNKSLDLWLRTICSNNFTFNTGNNTEIYVWVGTSAVGYVYVDSIQLEEGITATTYQSYKEDKMEILTTLKEWDSIDSNGVKTINTGETVLTGDEDWTLRTDANNGWGVFSDSLIFASSFTRIKKCSSIICNKLRVDPNIVGYSVKGIIASASGNDWDYLAIRVFKTDLQTPDLAGFKAWIKQQYTAGNPIIIQFQTITSTTEQIQPLQLNSYSSGSLIVNSNILPYVSVKYPQNIGANIESYSTVDIGRINDDNLSFPNYKNIKDSSDPVFPLDDVNTGIADVSVKGNTLVNLLGNKGTGEFTINKSSSGRILYYINETTYDGRFKANTAYTIMLNLISSDAVEKLAGFVVYEDDTTTYFGVGNTIGYTQLSITLTKKLKQFALYMQSDDYSSNKTVKFKNVMLLEGDYTNLPIPSYFEGMQSVSNVDVVSKSGNVCNILKAENGYSTTKNLIINKDSITFTSQWYCQIPLYLEPNTNYFVQADRNNTQIGGNSIGVYTKDIQAIKAENVDNYSFNSGSNTFAYLFFYAGKGIEGTSTYSNIQVKKDTTATTYEPYKEDKIKILSPLRRINNHIYDYINKDGYKIININEIILTGNESGWVTTNLTLTNTLVFGINGIISPISRYCICDKFRTDLLDWTPISTLDIEMLQVYTDKSVYVRILKSKLGILDTDDNPTILQKFKNYLSANNIKLQFQVNNTTERIQPLQISCFDNGSIAVNSIIPPYISIKYPTNKASALESYANIKVGEINSKLDENISKTKIVQDTADMAKDISDIAKSTAKTAKNTADSAISTSNTAKSTADTANSTANNAISVANTAKSTADTAVSTANQANTTANAGYTLASNALAKSGGAMTGALVGNSNNAYSTKQVRNVIISASDANIGQMGLGDIWIKYK